MGALVLSATLAFLGELSMILIWMVNSSCQPFTFLPDAPAGTREPLVATCRRVLWRAGLDNYPMLIQNSFNQSWKTLGTIGT